MDGYQTIGVEPPKTRRSRGLPVIALTAKAMKRREKSWRRGIGLSAKPLQEKLLLAIRMWLHR